MTDFEFKKTVLPNGFTVYSHIDKTVEFAYMEIATPVGSFHNHGEIIPGSFHFLEHLLAVRSQRNPELRSGMLKINLLGGKMNAYTSSTITSYNAQIPTACFEEALEILMSHFLEPSISDEDVTNEKGIIANERKRAECFYPGSSACSQYRSTAWMKDVSYPVRQIFGSDEDFEMMNAAYFHRLHESYYKTASSFFVIAGNFDIDLVCKKLGNITLTKPFEPLSRQSEQPSWNNREFHIFTSPEVSRFEYHLGWLYATHGGMHDIYHGFMNTSMYQILCSSSYGELFHWLRNEKQWVYELKRMGYTLWETSRNAIIVPLNSMEQVQEVREQIQDRMYKALSSEETLEKFKKQAMGQRVFDYQTVKSRMDRIMYFLSKYGEIYPENIYLEMLDSLSTDSLRSLFEKEITNNIGELVFVPEN